MAEFAVVHHDLKGGRVVVACLFGAVVLSSCAQDAGPDTADDASVEWQVDPSPIASVGLDESVEAELFGRIPAAHLLPGGGFLVLEAQSREIRAFSDSGAHLWTAGGPGDGPSELGYASDVGVLADGTIAVPDLGGWKIVRFAPSGEFIEASAIDRGSAQLVGAPRVPMTGGTIPLLGGEERAMAPSTELSFSEGTTVVQMLRGGEAEEVFRSPGGQGFQKAQDGLLRGGILPFGRIVAWDAGRDIIVVGNGHAPPTVIRETRTSRELPGPFPRVAVSAALKDRLLATRDEDRELYAEVLRSSAIPDSTPGYDRLWVDSSDRIWVRQYQVGAAAHRWAVLDSAGEVLGRVSLPLDSRFLDADDSRILIRRDTDIGVPFVEVRRLRPGRRAWQ